MREILFRGKSVEDGKWFTGQLLHFKSPVSEKELNVVVEGCEWDDSNEWFNLGRRAKVIPETVGQFTGLTDKNGKKIFDGDILDTPYTGKIKVCFDDGVFGADCGDGYGVLPLRRSIFGEGGIVIGNIYDNPELLERSKDNEQIH